MSNTEKAPSCPTWCGVSSMLFFTLDSRARVRNLLSSAFNFWHMKVQFYGCWLRTYAISFLCMHKVFTLLGVSAFPQLSVSGSLASKESATSWRVSLNTSSASSSNSRSHSIAAINLHRLLACFNLQMYRGGKTRDLIWRKKHFHPTFGKWGTRKSHSRMAK